MIQYRSYIVDDRSNFDSFYFNFHICIKLLLSYIICSFNHMFILSICPFSIVFSIAYVWLFLSFQDFCSSLSSWISCLSYTAFAYMIVRLCVYSTIMIIFLHYLDSPLISFHLSDIFISNLLYQLSFFFNCPCISDIYRLL